MRAQKGAWESLLFVFIGCGLTGDVLATALFSENFETGAPEWVLESPWAITSEDAHGGVYSLTDSPGSLYEKGVEKRATFQVSLLGCTRPVLSFWHKYNLEQDRDYGYVDVFTDGNYTQRTLFQVTGDSASEWTKEEIDLSVYANKEIRLRFRICTNRFIYQRDGWHIDDVEVSEDGATTLFPFFDDMETSASSSNWIASSWRRTATDGHDSAHCSAADVGAGAECYIELVLRGTLDLSEVASAQLSFWHHKVHRIGYVYVSADGGRTWAQAYLASLQDNWTDWRKTEVDLSSCAGKSDVLVKFVLRGWLIEFLTGSAGRGANMSRSVPAGPGYYWYIDDVQITGELVGPPKLAISVPGGAVTLSWAPFGTGSYTIEWSDDLRAWTPEVGMPISETTWAVGWIETYPKWRFWRVSSPAR